MALATRKEINAEYKAHAKAARAFAAKQVGPFFCKCGAAVENFDCQCQSCRREMNGALDGWYAAKPQIVGTF